MSRGVYVVGGRIKARRALLGMNQKKLAELVNVKQAHISKIESGGSVPSLGTSQKSIVRRFGMVFEAEPFISVAGNRVD